MNAAAQQVSEFGYEFTGTLVDNGDARLKQLDHDGHFVPVLILDVQSDGALHTPLHIEQLFPAGHMDQAKAAARRYRKGQRITVQAPALSLRLSVIAAHIHTIKEETEPQA